MMIGAFSAMTLSHQKQLRDTEAAVNVLRVVVNASVLQGDRGRPGPHGPFGEQGEKVNAQYFTKFMAPRNPILQLC